MNRCSQEGLGDVDGLAYEAELKVLLRWSSADIHNNSLGY